MAAERYAAKPWRKASLWGDVLDISLKPRVRRRLPLHTHTFTHSQLYAGGSGRKAVLHRQGMKHLRTKNHCRVRIVVHAQPRFSFTFRVAIEDR
jgi:hypothetical protein